MYKMVYVPCPSGQSNPAGDSNIGGNTYCKKIQFVALHVPYTGMHNPQVDYSCEDKGYETIRSLQLCKNALRPTLGIWWNIFETDSKPGYGCFEGGGTQVGIFDPFGSSPFKCTYTTSCACQVTIQLNDECTEGTDICHANSDCVDGDIGYRCECKESFCTHYSRNKRDHI